ncbi:MAG TPA: hypothetical protein VN923_18545, partial [Thermoanaerobaculia bacterium]|nr:hypothetical protein [Thermoanaerobaculia bacterium]
SQLTRTPGRSGPRLDSQLSNLYRAVIDGNLPPSPGIEERAADVLPAVERALATLGEVTARAQSFVASTSAK